MWGWFRGSLKGVPWTNISAGGTMLLAFFPMGSSGPRVCAWVMPQRISPGGQSFLGFQRDPCGHPEVLHRPGAIFVPWPRAKGGGFPFFGTYACLFFFFMRLSPLELLVIVVVFLLVFGNWPKLVKDGARRLASLKKSFSDAAPSSPSSGINPPETSSEAKEAKKVGVDSPSADCSSAARPSHGSRGGEESGKKT